MSGFIPAGPVCLVARLHSSWPNTYVDWLPCSASSSFCACTECIQPRGSGGRPVTGDGSGAGWGLARQQDLMATGGEGHVDEESQKRWQRIK